ncbi:MAG: 3-deoxy-7-phosphoheptulonate synthase [Actinomycetota bacterium]|jgi:3-deoxy-7-phosphoheptulonate synthase|nr:3-deoxy-7-phosphoheptulonate synthase [Actinomycetota bacterium]
MFVVVRSSNGSRGAVEAVRGQAQKAGLGTNVFEGEGRSVVGLQGDVPPELRAILQTIPGVEDVVGGETEAAEAKTRDLRVKSIRPLEPPAILLEQLPLSRKAATTVRRAREEVVRVLNGEDDRLIVVVGPCSVHDPEAALDYARRLLEAADELREDLLILMRVYFEKPRTTVGWKGLINDPHLDGSFDINAGLRTARGLLLEIAEMGLPAGCEVLDPISPQFFSDAIAWSAIGARTTESQVHRDLASGLSMPVGFKNGTDGNIQIAIDALRAADYPHHFLGVTEQGLAAIVNARGNADCHVILRGGKQTGTNYDAESVGETLEALGKVGLPERVMIDTSHGNSNKDYRRQPVVAGDVASQIAGGQRGIVGVLMESFLEDGNQNLTDGGADLVYGQSVTDACMGWEMTVPVLRELAEAVRSRRESRRG